MGGYKKYREMIRLIEKQKTELTQSKARIEQLQQWVNDLHAGMYVNCVYCGHRHGPDEDTPVAMADILKEHIEQCPEHPLSKATKRIRELEELIKPINNTYQDIDDHVELRTGCVVCSNNEDCEVLNLLTHILRVNLLALRNVLSEKSDKEK